MENFSTHRAAVVPQAANLLTLAVLVAATWWSGAQRPAELAAGAAPAPTMVANTNAAPLPGKTAGPATTGTSKPWLLPASTLPSDGLQAVGYQPNTTR